MTGTAGFALGERVEEMPAGLWVRRGAPPPMLSMHRHDDVEINLVLDGQLRYLFGGQALTISAGEIAIFWAAQPHGLVDSRDGEMCWLHVPFAQFLAWGLPEAQTAPLLSAQPLITHAPELATRIAGLATQWGREISGSEIAGGSADDGSADSDGAEIALLEIQAAVRRILRTASRAVPSPPADGGSVPAARLRQVGAMAQFRAEERRVGDGEQAG